ncbi:MAG TPA: LacI family DNA-binding transcriptional regulator [Mycobacteriales bacterium]|jgi:LacI family transcriptional regulator|nr:LacI family DNA-binding transcriptional regulator [Mycobacteriales bacterium]
MELAPRRRTARLADVAGIAGVHPSTVSRVLNGDPSVAVRPETSRRIREAARQAGYRPNSVARALRGSRTGSLGMVVPLLRNPIWVRLQAGALHRAQERGYVVMIIEEALDAPHPAIDYRYLVDESRVDGLMLANALRGQRPEVADPGVAHVFFNRRGGRGGNNVVMDEGGAVKLMVEHAVEFGHRSIALLDGPRAVDTVARRVGAARALCARHGIHLQVIHSGATEAEGYAAGVTLARRNRRPTLCAVGSINQLFGLYAALRDAKVDVPGDMSVVSFDEDECLAYLDVAVTSVSMPLDELGAASVDALLERINGEQSRDVVVRNPMTLVRRDSVARARSAT